MAKFYTSSSPAPALPSPSGDSKYVIYLLDEETGELVISGYGDTYQDIQDLTDVASLPQLIARAQQGDKVALNSNSGFYGDFSDLTGLTVSDLVTISDNINTLIDYLEDFEPEPEPEPEPELEPEPEPENN